jgi:RNA polymerase sigma-70 factor (ECF subfamily)
MNPDPRPPERSAGRTLDDVWRDERDHLHAIAARMLHDPAEADDVVQEAFGRLLRVDLDEIDDTRAWLTVVVRRLCLTRLASAYNRRESVAGAAPPDEGPGGVSGAAIGEGDPADRVTLDDQVQHALAVVLDRLSPAERTSFVLHDIFGFRFAEIGEIVGRTATACRQLASRARRTVRSSPPSSIASSAGRASDEHRRLVERFVAACNAGDVAGLVEVLDPDVRGETVTLAGQRLGHGEGATHVARRSMLFLGPESGTVLVPLLGESGVDIVAIYPDGTRGVFVLEIAEGVIARFRIVLVSSTGD